jgi:anti-repressor protein
MTDLQIFNYNGVNGLRAVTINDEAWFVAKDACDFLELGDVSKACSRLDDDEKGTNSIPTRGGAQEMLTVNEAGLYSLILGSRKPEAKTFKRWVTHEVLPSIRKHGLYATDQLLNDPDLAIRAFTALKEERERTKQLAATVERMKPKELFADSVVASNTSILIGELAKILKQNGIDVGQNRLFEWLRQKGYLISRQGTDYNMPTQRSMELKLFTIKETVVNHSDGHVSVNKTPKVTGKGQVYFVNKFLEKELAV